MLTQSQTSRLKVIIKRLIQAEISNAEKGAGDPSDIPYIEFDLAQAKNALEKYLSLITGKEEK